MRILLIHKHHYNLGGAERYYFELAKLLKKKGHEVAYFSLKDKKNKKTRWEKYFASNVTFENLKVGNATSLFFRMLYNLEAKRKISKLLDDFKPDIVHIQNIYNHISPSILPEIKKRGVPIIYTVHDYHLVSPNVNLFHGGRVCEEDGNSFFTAVKHKCINDSFMQTFGTALVWKIQEFMNAYNRHIDVLIVPSKFMRDRLTKNGFDPRKIYLLPNFFNCNDYKKSRGSDERFVLFFGRFYEHKGIKNILEVAGKLSEVKFKIVGDGKYGKFLKKFIKKNKLKNVELKKYLVGGELRKVISDSAFVVVPSLWYENFPYSILESFAAGKSVVASRIGGIPEIVKDGKNGLLFKPSDVKDFSEKIERLWEDPLLVNKLGETAAKDVKKKYNPEDHYKKILEVYNKAINTR